MAESLWRGVFFLIGCSFALPVAALDIAPDAITPLETKSGVSWEFARVPKDMEKPGATLDNVAMRELEWKPVEVPVNLYDRGLLPLSEKQVFYRLRFTLGKIPQKVMGLTLGKIDDRDRVYLNGTQIGGLGIWESETVQAYDIERFYLLPSNLFRVGGNMLIIRVKGIWKNFIGLAKGEFGIGDAEEIQRQRSVYQLVALAPLIFYIPIALFFLLLYLKYREDLAHLYFCIYTLSIIGYHFPRTQFAHNLGLSLYLYKEIEYIALFALIPLGVIFFRSFFFPKNILGNGIKRYILVGGCGIAAICESIIMFSSLHELRWFIYLWVILPSWPVLGGVILIDSIGLIRQKNKDIRIIAAGFGLVSSAVVIDTSTQLINIEFIRTAPFGLLLLVLALAYVLTTRYIAALNQQTIQEKMSVLGNFSAGVIHDLKGPIGIIQGYAEMADDRTIGAKHRSEFLRTIGDEAQNMTGMVQDVLDFSRGTLNLTLRRESIDDYIQGVAKLEMRKLKEQGIQLRLQLQSKQLVQIDRLRFRRVILNILNNSTVAMLQNNLQGFITISTKIQTNRVLISIEDNGPGMPPEIHKNLFKAFVSGLEGGIGLGLSVSKSIVEQHGGTINCISEPGQGAKFDIVLPVVLEKS